MRPTENQMRSFVRASEALSGYELSESHPVMVRHMALAQVCAEGHNLLDPGIVNAELRGIRDESWFRVGRSYRDRKFPLSVHVIELMDEWRETALAGIHLNQNAHDADKDACAWELHDFMIAVHPFVEENAKTARLMLNHLRRMMGRPWHMFELEKADQYFERIDLYRVNVFTPWYKKWLEDKNRI